MTRPESIQPLAIRRLTSGQPLSVPLDTGGEVAALFSSDSQSDGYAEVLRETLRSPAGARSRGMAEPAPATVFFFQSGWLWLCGKNPKVKTRRVVGGSDGTVYFARSTADADQFYFVGPDTSSVTLHPADATTPVRGEPVTIDARTRFAEARGGVIRTRELSPSDPHDTAFLATFERARLAAQAAGLEVE
jgi:hypothetical protein